MLDTQTLRVAFGVVTFTMLVLYYVVTFRPTRSPYCGWWCVALSLFLVGACAYLLNGTAQQYWANPAGNFLLVSGGAAAWAAARTLRARRPPLWQLSILPIATIVSASLDRPGTDVWAGGYIFLLSMSITFGLTTYELWQLDRDQTHIQVFLALAAGVSAVYYLGRWIAFLAEGADGDIFTRYFGSVPTTLLNLILLSVVSFSMSELSQEQTTKELTTRATRDGLTGVLNRAEFLRLAINDLRMLKRNSSYAALILADLDYFKTINDKFGHAAGDQVLVNFATACGHTVRSTDLVGRYGGDEFIIFLPGISLDRAEQIVNDINRQFVKLNGQSIKNSPADTLAGSTASYGVGVTEHGVLLEQTIGSVDAALYEAKQAGRNRVCFGAPVTKASDREVQPTKR